MFVDERAVVPPIKRVNGWLLVNRGQTVGKLICRIKVVRIDGSLPGIGQILLQRSAIPHLLDGASPTRLLLASIDSMLIFRRDQRCLHDLVARTSVVAAPPSGDQQASPPAQGTASSGGWITTPPGSAAGRSGWPYAKPLSRGMLHSPTLLVSQSHGVCRVDWLVRAATGSLESCESYGEAWSSTLTNITLGRATRERDGVSHPAGQRRNVSGATIVTR